MLSLLIVTFILTLINMRVTDMYIVLVVGLILVLVLLGDDAFVVGLFVVLVLVRVLVLLILLILSKLL